MNKTKMILAGIGGAAGLAVLVLAFLVWQAFSAKTAAIEGDDEEGIDGLETVEARAQGLSRKPVYPCAKSVDAISANQTAIDDWCKESLKLATRGDKVFPKTTPAQFKADIVNDAKRLMSLPGRVGGKLVKPDFAFGPFKDYIVEGKMPAEAELGTLQRQWDDVATIAEMLATNGVAELVDVQFAVAKKDEGPETKDTRRGKADKRKGSAKSNNRTIEQSIIAHSYVFTFAAKPAAFIQTLNELEASERFITVDSFTFARPVDAIAAALGGDDKKSAEAQSSGRRGRRGRRGAEQSAPVAEDGDGTGTVKNGLVTDPLKDDPLTVTMTVTVHDFRSLEEEKSEEEKALCETCGAELDEEGKQTARTLARNMSFLMKSIALGKEKFGMPEKEKQVMTNFIG